MARRNKYPLLENVLISDIGAEGKALARLENKVVFVTGAIPGDVVDIQVKRKRKSFMEGRVVRFHKYSQDREEAVCEHFGVCGGCKWQMLPYEKQIGFKEKQVKDQLERIGGFKGLELNPILGSKESEFYRNKLEFTFSNKRWLTEDEIKEDNDFKDRDALGFHIPGLFDKIVDIKKCWLQPDPSNAIRLAVKSFALENKLSFFDIREQVGLLRNLIIRTASTGEVMVIVSFFEDDSEAIKSLMDHLKDKFPDITSLQYVVNQKKNDTILDQRIICYHGRDHIFEKMEELKFKIGPKSFYQTNSSQAYELYKVARDFADFQGHETVYDLYTGTGTIANFMASKVNKVVGIEAVPEAIDDARVNAELNGITNAEFVVGDMKDVFNDTLFTKYGRPDVIILDPPRAGLHENVIIALKKAKAQKIIYISCNPATQARDLALLADLYTIEAVQPVDMFPHTHHVENIVKVKLI
ncbi:MAG: 23S rRNA (uracil(1939)-C(5))-methyltransferase RlmD [Bacteroidales bacterium]|nr:23S rRNA (uracil(1939)-C(5))-methyltransferase RlmD [Bacteroidales bacterium]